MNASAERCVCRGGGAVASRSVHRLRRRAADAVLLTHRLRLARLHTRPRNRVEQPAKPRKRELQSPVKFPPNRKNALHPNPVKATAQRILNASFVFRSFAGQLDFPNRTIAVTASLTCSYFSISGAQCTNSWFQNLNCGFLMSSMKVMRRPQGCGRFTINLSSNTLQHKQN